MYNKKNVKKYQKKNKKGHKGPSKNFSRMVKQVLFKNSESKFVDSTYSSSSLISTTATEVSNNLSPTISKGTTENDRIGDQIYQKGIQCSFTVNSLVSHTLRMLVVKVSSNESPTDFLLSGGIGVLGLYPRDVINYQYKVVMDRLYNLDPDQKGTLTQRFYLKCNNNRQFNDTDNTQSTNRYYWIFYTTNSTVSMVSLDTQTRYIYKDI